MAAKRKAVLLSMSSHHMFTCSSDIRATQPVRKREVSHGAAASRPLSQ